MLVSVALFATIAVMALGALLSLSVADRRAEAMKSAMDNLTFALDSMSRAIRTGSTYHCGSTGVYTTTQDCPTGSNFLTLATANGSRVYYQLDTAQDATSHCGQTTLPYGCIERSTDGSTWFPITSPDLVLSSTGFLFYSTGAAVAGVQPVVLITTSGVVQITGAQQQTFRMQTAVTQRIYDL